MKKYKLEVELECDDKCNGCPALDEPASFCGLLRTHILYERHQKMSGVSIDYIKHEECPLIPIPGCACCQC